MSGSVLVTSVQCGLVHDQMPCTFLKNTCVRSGRRGASLEFLLRVRDEISPTPAGSSFIRPAVGKQSGADRGRRQRTHGRIFVGAAVACGPNRFGRTDCTKRVAQAPLGRQIVARRSGGEYALDQAKHQLPVLGFVPCEKALEARRHLARLEPAAPTQLLCDIGRNIPRPSLSGIEADDANRVPILPVE
jgi:hypothetical protein